MRFDPDWAGAQASIPIYDKVRGQVQVTDHKPFVRTNRKGKTIAGVRFSLRMVGLYDAKGTLDREKEGKALSSYTVWVHTPGGLDFAKSFQMACLGFDLDHEEDANEAIKKLDWAVNGEPVEGFEATCGDGYAQLVGAIVDVTLNKSSREDEETGDTRENQEFSNWAPATSKKRSKK